MKWYQDFSNILALMALPVGVALILFSPEHSTFGEYLVAYALGIGTKVASSKIPLKKAAGVILIALLLNGCITPMVPPNVAGTIQDVCDRHDAWAYEELLEQDITALDHATFLEDTKILRAYIKASQGQIE